jgi:hypothetical protein
MQTKLSKIILLTSICVMVIFIGGSPTLAAETADFSTGLRTAVLPLKDYTNNSHAHEPIIAAIYASLEEQGIRFVSSEELRPILRRNRIRVAGSISPDDAAAIGSAVEVDLLMVGSIDFFRDIQNLECGLSLRLVSPNDMTILSAVSYSATAKDQIGLFETGQINNISDLIPRVASKLIQQLYAPLLKTGARVTNANSAVRTVVLPFENISQDRHAGSIAANWLLAELVDRGFTVIEPGSVADLTLPNGGLPVGEIDFPRLQLVHDELSAEVIITGEVDRFIPDRSLSRASKPEIEFGLRMTDAASGLVIATVNAEHDGGQAETVFGLGRHHSLGLLMQSAFREAVKKLKPRMIEYASGKP